MALGGLTSGFRRFCAQSGSRSVKNLTAAALSPSRHTARCTGHFQHKQALFRACRDGKILSHGRQLRSLQPAGTLHTATRLQSMGNDVVLAATSSDALQRKVSHILLKADQAELLDELEERIQGGEDFREIAAEYSNCASSVRGGAIGWVEKDRTAPTFEEAVYEADIGELVRAETHHGLHLIKVEAERQQAGIVQMPVTELASILEDPERVAKYQFVDVREPAEEAISRIKQFQLFPLSKLREWGPSLKLNLDVNKPTIVMCHHGVRSQQAAQYLESQGFAQLNNVKGGIHEYSVVADNSVPVY